ncbi:Cysteine protease [Giardia duodenalis]|uniref:ATP-dependent RNA helicase n=1 Tax=Giardia intestinalis TaxID=5741 RepID=V6U1I4_GIAIN|nr:Cysteine protease [Giardia intestinalis]
MANNVFIASATGSGKTLPVILPLALEVFAGLDFVALFVVPTTHLLAQTPRLLLCLFHDVPSVQVLQAMDCLGATLYEDPALLRLDLGVVAELREHRASQAVGTDTPTSVDDHLVKRLLGSLTERRATKTPDLRRIVGYGADRTSHIICGTPGIVSALLAAIEPAPGAGPDPRATASSSKLRHVVIDEADHVLLNDNTAFLMLAGGLFVKQSPAAVFRVPRFFAERHRLGLPTDRFVFLSATMKYRASLLENMGLHGGLMIDFDGQEGARLALSPNVEHFVIQFKQPYSEIDIAYLVFRFLCSPGGAIANPRTTLLPCIIFVNSRHTMQRVAHLLFLIMVKIYRKLWYRIVLVARTRLPETELRVRLDDLQRVPRGVPRRSSGHG